MNRTGTHVIVVGNEKGGSGKSTTAFHLSIYLLHQGFRVASIDVDSRQQTYTHYVRNRRAWAKSHDLVLPHTTHYHLPLTRSDSVKENHRLEFDLFRQAVIEVEGEVDFLIVDTPGFDTHLTRLAHSLADTLITPLNDSFVDFDLLADVDPQSFDVRAPSLYSEMVWESRKRRALRRHAPIDWVVMRNRLTQLDAKNKRKLADMLDTLAARIGFRVAPGFGERVIYRELFPLGLTLLDLADVAQDYRMTMSHVAARQEMRSLITMLNLPGLGDQVAAL